MQNGELRTGKVKFWHDEKGYAFIIDDIDGKEYYTHRNYFVDPSVRLVGNIENGKIERVQYELKDKSGRNRNEIHAKRLTVIE